MKLNYKTCLVGPKNVVLVPYRPCHVERYHQWMQDPTLLEATGSEPLTLAEEYEMQQSWKNDPNKCTFIILSKDKLSLNGRNRNQNNNDDDDNDDNKTKEFRVQDYLHAMVGDVNLFLSEMDDDDNTDDDDDDGDDDDQDQDPEEDERTVHGSTVGQPSCHDPTKGRRQAELDIMVAEPSARGRGLGKEAVCCMMHYGIQYLNVQRFFVKIHATNVASRHLFTHSLAGAFVECNYAACFAQYEYEWWVPEQWNNNNMMKEEEQLPMGDHPILLQGRPLQFLPCPDDDDDQQLLEENESNQWKATVATTTTANMETEKEATSPFQ